MNQSLQPWNRRMWRLLIGRSRDLHDTGLFHKMSLTAFFAWIALGSDGISSSCYGPQEAFLALGQHTDLAIFVALASAVTVFIISASYSQIIELFPSGGGGYLVASKLLSPTSGMVSGCALLVDYVLTVTVSIASGAEAIFSFLPPHLQQYRLFFAIGGVIGLTMLNLRGVKESVLPLVPVFVIFVVTHAIAIAVAFGTHVSRLPEIASQTVTDISQLHSQIGMTGVLFILLRAYSMGAGTYTGIEAVSNGLPVLREPRVATAKRTMMYIALSLSVIVVGLVISYLLFGAQLQQGKTLNAVLLEALTNSWDPFWGRLFLLVTLISEAALLFVAAETGFVDGPRVMANMALDRWLPTRFAHLSDRFVSQNGVLFMGVMALIMMVVTRGSVTFLVILYSINVFVTFVLSQLGMVRHWWQVRRKESRWRKKLAINGVGFVLCAGILVSVIIVKFEEGGWLTFVVTGAIVGTSLLIRRHYRATSQLLRRLDTLVDVVRASGNVTGEDVAEAPGYNPGAKTAVMTVSGFNGTGLHTLLNIRRVFGDTFRNFVFIHVGVVDAGNFKGAAELQNLEVHTDRETQLYIEYMHREGFHAIGLQAIGTDVVTGVMDLTPRILEKYPNAVFFGGQLVFPEESFVTRWLHNYIVFSLQRRFYHKGLPFMIMPIRA